ncbi:hypothetical protein ABT160_16830 [Streptomyces sp. NPDC001941]|uniref:hypothetical protein n=1 Tax=Streptomyces sp. NPDC001941 TaxID=3154659 RepID=UPI00331E1876
MLPVPPSATPGAPVPPPPTTARVAELLAGAAGGGQGALWRLSPEERQLDSNVIRLAAGSAIDAHVEPLLDVLLYVCEGTGSLALDDVRLELEPGRVVWMPAGARRAVHAGPGGLVHLTVHRRRPALSIGGAEGGEPACLLDRVCPECGRLSGDRDARYCGRCGTALRD